MRINLEKIKYNIELMEFISIFESLTRAKAKDCFMMNDRITYIVEQNEIGKAIGKGGSNIKRLEAMLKKKIRVIEFSSDVCEFIKNIIYPLRVEEIKKEGTDIIIKGQDTKTKGLLIGRDRQNINQTKSIADRFFEISAIKVV